MEGNSTPTGWLDHDLSAHRHGRQRCDSHPGGGPSLGGQPGSHAHPLPSGFAGGWGIGRLPLGMRTEIGPAGRGRVPWRIARRHMSRRLPHPHHQRWRHPIVAHRLQEHPHQAVLQGGTRIRTETTINDTYDFAVGRSLRNLGQLRTIGFAANRRLLGRRMGAPAQGEGRSGLAPRPGRALRHPLPHPGAARLAQPVGGWALRLQ